MPQVVAMPAGQTTLSSRFSRSTLTIAVAGALFGASPAYAGGTFSGPGGIEGRWGLEVTVGTAVRMENPNKTIVATGNGGTAASGTVDDGNLNFKKGDVFSTVAKAVGEVEVRKGDVGAFFRAKAYSDLTLTNKKVPHGSSNNAYVANEKLNDEGLPDGSRFEDVQLLEAYAFADFYPGDKPFTIKAGNQVVTWGEALFVLGGINQYSNFDAAALRRPGAQLKEVFLPLPQVYANFQATDELSIEAFGQLTHEKVVVDGCGTLFSPADLLNCGRSGSVINPGALALGNGLFADFSSYNDRGGFSSASSAGGQGNVQVVGADGNPIAAPVTNPLLSALVGADLNFKMDEAKERRPSDSGQIGLATRYYAGSIGTEFGVYAVNYHQRVPNLSLINIATTDPRSIFSGDTAASGAQPNQGGFIGSNLGVPGLSYFFDYGAEDIQVVGLSAATELGGFSVFGEMSFTKDYPAGYNTVDLIKGSATNTGPLGEQGRGAGNGYQDLANNGAPGTVILAGSRPLDKLQAQMSTIKLFPRVLGAASWAMVGEVGAQYWKDVGDPFTEERYGRSPAFGAGAHATYNGGVCDIGVNASANKDPRYCSTDGYATDTSAGYRVLFAGDYPNAFNGVTLKPRIFFSHDFHGTSVDGVFLEDRKNLGLGLRAEIQSGKYFAETNYSIFDDKAFFDPFKDRDFLSLVLGANL